VAAPADEVRGEGAASWVGRAIEKVPALLIASRGNRHAQARSPITRTFTRFCEQGGSVFPLPSSSKPGGKVRNIDKMLEQLKK
jgi:hypothetical protein